MSKSERCYTFLLIQNVQFERDIDSPVLVKVTRKKEHSTIKKTLFKAQTTYLMADASHSIHYDSEFCIKIKLVKKHDKIGKQIINIKLEEMNAVKKKREKIGEWHFDAANFENPTSVDIRESKTTLKHNLGQATLYFRCVVLPYSDYPDGPPEHFYNFVARTYSPQFVDVNDTASSTNDLTMIDDISSIQISTVNIIQKSINTEAFNHQPQENLASFLKPVEMKSSKKKQTESEQTPSESATPKVKKVEEAKPPAESEGTNNKEQADSKSSSKRKKSDVSKAEDDDKKKKKKKRRKTSDLKEFDTETGDKKEEKKKSKRKHSDTKHKAESAENNETDATDQKEPEEPATKELENDQKESEATDLKEQETKEQKEQKESENDNQDKTEYNKNDDEPKKENVEKIPKFTQNTKSSKQKKANLSNINSFFGDKKIRKRSSNLNSSDNVLQKSGEVQKPIHSYNRLHLSQYYDDFQPLYKQHQKALMELAVNQCSPIFIKTVMDCLVAPPNVLQDFSDRLLDPINSYGILQLPALTSDVLLDLISPVYKGIKISINRPHQLDEWFSILATTLNFGLKLSNTASLYTSAHIECLNSLAKHISQIIQQLTQTLVATIAPSISDDGFTFADDQAMSMIEQHTRLFLEYTQAFKIPDQIVQVIVIETCNYIDTLLFNVIIDTATIFTDDKVTSLLQKIRQIQQMFDCIPKNFQAAFTHLLSFISQTKALWIGLGDETQKKVILHEKGPLLRSIVERCQPPVEIPEDMSLDDFGEKVESTKSLKLPLETASFTFTFEWLYTQNTSNDWDML